MIERAGEEGDRGWCYMVVLPPVREGRFDPSGAIWLARMRQWPAGAAFW